MKHNTIGMAWFTFDHFMQLRSMFEDADHFQTSYADWLNSAEESYAKQLQYGLSVAKVYLDPIEFPKWCEMQGFRLDAEARVTYANAVANQMFIPHTSFNSHASFNSHTSFDSHTSHSHASHSHTSHSHTSQVTPRDASLP